MIKGICRRTLFMGVAIVAPVIALGSASPAFAAEHHPTGPYAVFKDCPLANPAANGCVYALTEGGEFIVGTSTVPIKHTLTLQGGVHVTESGVDEFIAAENGETLSKTPQAVPGGLAGLVKCYEISNIIERVACELVFENGLTGVNATTELAGPASSIGLDLNNLIEEKGTAITLPVKVHLENPLLGSECYIGSNSKPIPLPLTTGTTSPPAPNKPISGSRGELTSEEFVLVTRGNVLVNNSFAAPEAQGCGGLFSFLIDPLVNAKLGLPSSAGHNTAILKGALKLAETSRVKESE
ncbi:MAG TPA: hypothetical protein VMF09_01225 [Solirubrobacteraceae bacterium]|nr:hypothetical protein [Solirubrobacteraceae bacterium]